MAGKKQPIRYASCHPDRVYEAKGLCMACYRKQNENIRKYMKGYLREWRKRNREKCSGYVEKRLSDPVKRARVRERQYASRVKSKYGLTEAALADMMRLQNNQCGICDQHMDKPNIDHCHTTGKVRGLLCNGCNTGIGMFKESIPALLKAADYIFEHVSVGQQTTA